MSTGQRYKIQYDTMRDLLFRLAETPSAESLPGTIVDQMASRAHVALARVWLLRPGDLCEDCPWSKACSHRTGCLHLVATRGKPLRGDAADWATLDGWDRRLCPGSPEAAAALQTARPVRIPFPLREADWTTRNPWARGEEIRGASYYPIVFRGETLGLIGVYTRIDVRRIHEGPFWMSMVANQLAVALVNARALDQIEGLRARLELENSYLREEIADAGAFGDIVGRSPPLMNLLEQVNLVAPTQASVLILGESGTGKELLAREIHRRSLRRDKPMIKVNCAAIPAELYESEFFGHVRGAFTGAVAERAGRFQAADGGTLFLDEVGEIPLVLQGKLLRVLQEGAYERIGEEVTRQVDVRIIAATNRDLKRDVATGRFRQDLYYRLNVFPIEVVPLRQRRADIVPLAEHFLRMSAARMNRPAPGLTRAHAAELESYDWPGNVRELQNVIERAVITANSGRLRFDLPAGRSPAAPPSATQSVQMPDETSVLSEAEVRSRARLNLENALRACGGKIYGPDGAAALLGVGPTTLSSRMTRLGIRSGPSRRRT